MQQKKQPIGHSAPKREKVGDQETQSQVSNLDLLVVQAAKILGAGRGIAAGRNPDMLSRAKALGPMPPSISRRATV